MKTSGLSLSVLTWNLDLAKSTDSAKREAQLGFVKCVASQEGPDILLLQETTDDVCGALASKYHLERGRPDLITAYDRNRFIQAGSPDESIRRCLGLTLQTDGKWLFVLNVHLPSRLRRQDSSIEKHALWIAEGLRERRATLQRYEYEIVGGDFNLEPYRRAMLYPWPLGINATRSLAWAARRYAPTDADRALYNPTWQLLASKAGDPCGTYYRNGEGDGPWYAYDQILIAGPLVGRSHSIRTMRRINGKILSTNRPPHAPNRRVTSDHYPVLLKLEG